jgi:hypothetical protein
MGKVIVTLIGEGIMMEEARQWESRVFQQVCDEGRREASGYLALLDERLFAQCPAGWVVVGFRERTLVTRFGEVEIRRRLYQDRLGEYHFLLDEYLGLNANQAATPAMQAMCTMLCGEISFRKAADFLEQWMVGLLSHSTCWRLLQRTGEAAANAREEEVEAVFSKGEPIAQAGERRIERLYMEADGVYVRLQRQPKKHLELCSAIAYEGWERLPGIREVYRLREKQAYCHVGNRVSFWEGVSLGWAHKWDLRHVREVIIGGDGAAWVRAGANMFAGASWQLDGFHLARACRQAFGSQAGQELYQTLRTGDTVKMQASLSQTPVREGKQAQRASRWVEKVAQEQWGLDWRVRQGLSMEEAHGLGCMEGNQAQLLAARMKGKGRSWSPDGAYHMAKVQELLANDEVQPWCYRHRRSETPKTRYTRHPHSPRYSPDQWMQAAVPAFYGPSPNAPWVRYLRQLIHPIHLLN